VVSTWDGIEHLVGMESFATQSTMTTHDSRRQRDEEQRDKHEEYCPSNSGCYYRDARKSEYGREDCGDETNYRIVQHDPLASR